MAKKQKRKLHNCICKTCQSHPHSKTAREHKAINRVLLGLDERNRRRFIGMLASQRGNVAELSEITGMSRNTIYRGQQEVDHPRRNTVSGIRRPGGGRQAVEKNNPDS
jgi:DNA-binding phage protein